jgi:hypothetical protein
MPNYSAVVVTTVLVAVGGAEAKRITHKEPLGMSPVLGGFLLGIFLFAFGIANAGLAAKFCLLIIVSSTLVNGLSVFSLLSGKTATTHKTH